VVPPRFKLDLKPVNVERMMGWSLVLECLEVVDMAQHGVLRPAMMFGERIAEKDIMLCLLPCCTIMQYFSPYGVVLCCRCDDSSVGLVPEHAWWTIIDAILDSQLVH